MFQVSLNLPETPVVTVHSTENRGFTPEEVAARCTDKIVAVAETAPPAIRDQAVAYKKAVERVIAQYMREAIRSDRTTVYNALKDAGHPELADAIRRL
jgi:hypothetical protein